MEPQPMKLYAYRYCPFSRRVRIALAEHAAEFELVEHEPKAPYPKELEGYVPGDSGVPVLLVREGFAVWDSTAIIHWIDSSHPRSLYPSQRDPQALARAWQAWIQNKMYPKFGDLRDGKPEAEKAVLDALRTMEPHLGPVWMIDSEFSVADLTLAPIVAELSSKAIESLPERMREYVGKVRARPSVREVCELDLPENVDRPSHAA
jgi:glutathione S-transferase